MKTLYRSSMLVAALAWASCTALFPEIDNPKDCTLNADLCPSQGLLCDTKTHECRQNDGSCQILAQCMAPTAAVCNSDAGKCIPCSADNQCLAWAVASSQTLPYKYCLTGGICGTCKTNAECSGDATKPICDPQTFTCRGCNDHADCDTGTGKGDGVCHRVGDYTAGTAPVPEGQCVPASSITLVSNNAPGCDAAGAGGKPFCSLTTALMSASRKQYVKLLPSSTNYPSVTWSSGDVNIVGPGRDASPSAVLGALNANGGRVVLSDAQVNSTMPMTTAVMCQGNAELSLYRSIITSPPLQRGINADVDCAVLNIDRSRIKSPGSYAIGVGAAGVPVLYRIVNTAIVGSGGLGTTNPIQIGGLVNSMSGFSYNTVVGTNGGVECVGLLPVSDSIIQVTGGDVVKGCTMARVASSGIDLQAGDEPKLLDTPNNIQKVVDQGQPTVGNVVTYDYYGTKRPLGAKADWGYHELK